MIISNRRKYLKNQNRLPNEIAILIRMPLIIRILLILIRVFKFNKIYYYLRTSTNSLKIK